MNTGSAVASPRANTVSPRGVVASPRTGAGPASVSPGVPHGRKTITDSTTSKPTDTVKDSSKGDPSAKSKGSGGRRRTFG